MLSIIESLLKCHFVNLLPVIENFVFREPTDLYRVRWNLEVEAKVEDNEGA